MSLKLKSLFVPLVFASACGQPDPQLLFRGSDVILISVDTLRRDHLGAYSATRSATPALNAIAAEAVVFDAAYAQIPFTLPSHLSMLTGLQPDVHGVERKTATLSSAIPTLPEIAAAGGYETIGLAANAWMKGEFGFARGFDHYEVLTDALTYAERVNRRAFELLDARGPSAEPLLLFLHYYDPHSDFSNVERNTLPYHASRKRLESLGIDPDTREFCADERCSTAFLLAANDQPELVDAASLARIRALYAAGVEDLDRSIGALVEGLRRRGLWDDAMVILTADHGEELREHGEFIHNQPYIENLAIPLMIRLPGSHAGGSRRAAVVESIDLLPTILDLVGLETPAPIQGRSFVPTLLRAEPHRPHALGRDKKTPTRYALRTAELTLVHDVASGTAELYSLRSDPEELTDLSLEYPDEVARLRGTLLTRLGEHERLRARVKDTAQDEVQVLTAEEEKQLRALGYLD